MKYLFIDFINGAGTASRWTAWCCCSHRGPWTTARTRTRPGSTTPTTCRSRQCRFSIQTQPGSATPTRCRSRQCRFSIQTQPGSATPTRCRCRQCRFSIQTQPGSATPTRYRSSFPSTRLMPGPMRLGPSKPLPRRRQRATNVASRATPLSCLGAVNAPPNVGPRVQARAQPPRGGYYMCTHAR